MYVEFFVLKLWTIAIFGLMWDLRYFWLNNWIMTLFFIQKSFFQYGLYIEFWNTLCSQKGISSFFFIETLKLWVILIQKYSKSFLYYLLWSIHFQQCIYSKCSSMFLNFMFLFQLKYRFCKVVKTNFFRILNLNFIYIAYIAW